GPRGWLRSVPWPHDPDRAARQVSAAGIGGTRLGAASLPARPVAVRPLARRPAPSLTKKIGRAPAIDAVRLERVPARQAPARHPYGTRREPLRAAAFPP